MDRKDGMWLGRGYMLGVRVCDYRNISGRYNRIYIYIYIYIDGIKMGRYEMFVKEKYALVSLDNICDR